MTLPDDATAYSRRAQERIGWVLDGNYAEPSDELKPFVIALLRRAVDGDDDDADRALEALRKLFPPPA